MDGVIRLDTHLVVWLFVVSPLVQLELSYLREIGRLTIGGADMIADLEGRVGLRRSELALEIEPAQHVRVTRS